LIAKEKLHGTNLQWVLSSNEEKKIEIRAAKRSGYLEEKDTFYNWQNVLEEIRKILEDTFHVCALLFKLEEKKI